jgi:hypothetical protein
VHIHFAKHRTLSRNGVAVKPNVEVNASVAYARKDVVELSTNKEIRVGMRFRDMNGRYVMHCHNVVHEDHAMRSAGTSYSPAPYGARLEIKAGATLHHKHAMDHAGGVFSNGCSP